MHGFAVAVASFAPPPLTVVLVFLVAYLLVGIPVHLRRGAESRDLLGTLAGIFAAVIYIALVVWSLPGRPTGLH